MLEPETGKDRGKQGSKLPLSRSAFLQKPKKQLFAYLVENLIKNRYRKLKANIELVLERGFS